MAQNSKAIGEHELAAIHAACAENADRLKERFGAAPKACVVTFGCQQNEADSELIKAMLLEMGCALLPGPLGADIVVFNTCAIREHAEKKALSGLGEMSHIKKANPRAIICLCGCMAQQPHVAERIKHSFPYIDIVFGTHALARFPELIGQRLAGGARIFERSGSDAIVEGIKPARENSVRAWLSIMYGCNNFCSYCIVPHVRGRERSREPEAVLTELEGLVQNGYKDITLLGQNVNSYGRDLGGTDFATLLKSAASLDGEYRLRFMTSHPKDATPALFDAMAENARVCASIHLPVQAGSDRVLGEMNRRYTAAEYIKLVEYARSVMPGITITSDIIVGFPGETEAEFEQTLDLLRAVRFDSLFTFIYSPRKGTKAAEMPDPVPREQKQVWFDRLLEAQNTISREINDGYVGTRQHVLVDGHGSDKDYPLSARTEGFKLVHVKGGDELIGRYVDVTIEKRSTWALFGGVS